MFASHSLLVLGLGAIEREKPPIQRGPQRRDMAFRHSRFAWSMLLVSRFTLVGPLGIVSVGQYFFETTKNLELN
jgi:hypothetical protein